MNCLRRLEHAIYRNRVLLLSLVLMGVLIDLLYRGQPVDLGIVLVLVGPVMKWIHGRGQAREAAADAQFDTGITADLGAIRMGGIPPASEKTLTDLFKGDAGK